MKTRIQVASDVHLEFTGMGCDLDTVSEESRDILIVAGDLAEGTRGFDWLRYQCSFSDVVYVAGNHEYYGHDIDEVDKRFRDFANTIPTLHFLQKDTVELFGLKIAGCTLWTDMQDMSGWERRQVEKSMTDFCGAITKRHTRLTADIACGINMDHRNWLMGQQDADIVVTHHAPSWQSVTDYWLENGKLLNPAFAGNSDDLIRLIEPKYWIHGHMHSFMRYWHDEKVGGTQILCNPRGYGGSYQERTGFSDNFMISLD
jgi:Icc-related predicted phosphoesterase